MDDTLCITSFNDRVDEAMREYRPLPTKEGLLDMRAMVAYRHTEFMLSVYVLSVPKGAGSKGGRVENMRIDKMVMRCYVPRTTPEEVQQRLLEFYCNVVATRYGIDYKLRLPIRPKQPSKE